MVLIGQQQGADVPCKHLQRTQLHQCQMIPSDDLYNASEVIFKGTENVVICSAQLLVAGLQPRERHAAGAVLHEKQKDLLSEELKSAVINQGDQQSAIVVPNLKLKIKMVFRETQSSSTHAGHIWDLLNQFHD